MSGSVITSGTRQQTWTLDQAGNWDQIVQSGPENYTDDRTHNTPNELTERDIASGPTYTHTNDAVGNMTDDGAAAVNDS